MMRKIAAAALAALLVTTGAVAAAPGSAPTDSPAGEHADESNQSHANGTDANETDSDRGASAGPPETAGAPANGSERGPPTDMPSQVPDHVVRIHETIQRWLAGDLGGSLGSVISDILGGGSEAAGSHSSANGQSDAGGKNASSAPTETPAGG